MTNKKPNDTPPPGWEDDNLSRFIEDSRRNTFATFVRMEPAYKLLSDIENLYQQLINKITSKKYKLSDEEEILSPYFFLVKSHISFLGAARLSLSGQTSEAYMAIRGCIESSLYGLHIHQNKNFLEIWLKRHDNEQSMSQCKSIFSHAKTIKTLKKLNVQEHDLLKILYNRCIDYGAHPNERSWITTISLFITDNKTTINSHYFQEGNSAHKLCLKTNIEAGLCSLENFKYAYKEQFDAIEMFKELDLLKNRIMSINWN